MPRAFRIPSTHVCRARAEPQTLVWEKVSMRARERVCFVCVSHVHVHYVYVSHVHDIVRCVRAVHGGDLGLESAQPYHS